MTERSRVEEVALRVVDGEAIDWRSELDDRADTAAHVLNNLRLVDTIARTLREQPAEPADEAQVRNLLDSLHALPSREPVLAPGSAWGPLQIRRHIGAGAFADVYRAFDPGLQREVALKLFRSARPELQRRMLGEGRRLARINHPGVVRVYGAEEHGGRVGLWMELVEGRSLDESRPGGRKLSPGEVALIGRTLCGALAAVHQAGVIHGDVKAQNVLRDDTGRLVLTDFGSGLETGSEADPSRLRGTPLYLAPELLEGERATPRSDVYSLGVLLYFLATGTFPVTADSLPELRAAHCARQRQPLVDLRPDVPEALAAAIERALEPEPERRFPTMGEFARALGREQAAEPPSTGKRRRSMLALGILLAVVAAAWLLSGPVGRSLQPDGAYQLDLTLYRLGADGAERIGSGTQVAVGDGLALEVSASTDLHVFVFNEDQRGHAYALFPIASAGAANPLAGGESHWLPGGPGESHRHWRVDSAGGMERIHVIASPAPLPDVERLYASLPTAQLPGAAGPVFRARGIGTVEESPLPGPVSATALAQAAANAAKLGTRLRGVHYQVIELRNPGE